MKTWEQLEKEVNTNNHIEVLEWNIQYFTHIKDLMERLEPTKENLKHMEMKIYEVKNYDNIEYWFQIQNIIGYCSLDESIKIKDKPSGEIKRITLNDYLNRKNMNIFERNTDIKKLHEKLVTYLQSICK